MQREAEQRAPIGDDRRHGQIKGGLPDLRRFRRLQREQGATHLDDLTPAQLGLTDVSDLHHISRMKARDGSCIFRVRICKTCSRLQHLIELGSYKRLEPAILVHDAHELLHRRIHKLRVLTAEDRPYLHLLTVSNHGRAVNLERIFVIDILADRIKKYYVARFFSGSASALMLSRVSACDSSSPAQSPKRSNDDGMYQTVDDVLESLREMREMVGASNSSNALALTPLPSNLDSTLPSMAETFTYHSSLLSLTYLIFRLTGSIMDVQMDTAQFATLLLSDPARKLEVFNPASSLPPSLWKLAALSYIPLRTNQLRPLIQQLDVLQAQQQDEAAMIRVLAEHSEALVATTDELETAAHIEALRQCTKDVAELVFTTSHDMRLPAWVLAGSPTSGQRRGYIAHLEELFRRISKRVDQLLLVLHRISQRLAMDANVGRGGQVVEPVGQGEHGDSTGKLPEQKAADTAQAEIRRQLIDFRQRLAALTSWDTLQIQGVTLLLELGGTRSFQDYDVAVQVCRRFDELGIGEQLLGGIQFCRAGSMVSLCAQRCRTVRTSSFPHAQELKRALLNNQLLLLESCAEMVRQGLTIGIAFRTGDDIPSGSAFLSSHESTFWAYANLLAVYHAVDTSDQDGITHLYNRVTQELHVPAAASFESLMIPPLHVVLNAVQALVRSMRDWVEQTNCTPYLICTYYSLHAVGCAAATFLTQQRFGDRHEQLEDVLQCALGILSACSDRFALADYLWRLLRDRSFYRSHALPNAVAVVQKRARTMTVPEGGRMVMSQSSSYSRAVPLTHALPEFLHTQSGFPYRPQFTPSMESANSAATTPSDEGNLPPTGPLLHPAWHQTYTSQLDPPPLLAEQLTVIHNPEIDYDYTNEEIHALLSIFDV